MTVTDVFGMLSNLCTKPYSFIPFIACFFRVYCTGSFVSKETSRIPSIVTGSTYDVATLKELAVAHGRDIASCK